MSKGWKNGADLLSPILRACERNYLRVMLVTQNENAQSGYTAGKIHRSSAKMNGANMTVKERVMNCE